MTRPPPSAMAAELAANPVFRGLDEETIALLASQALRREAGPGDVLFLEGEPSAGLYLLECGWVKVVKSSAQGREQALQFIGPGELFNIIGIFSGRPNPATAIALEPSVAWLLPRKIVARLLRNRPDFAERVLENMADRMVHLVELVADLSLRTVMARLARLILERAEGDVLRRQRWFTLAELAARVGSVPDVAQRAMARLSADGLIAVDRREIRILDAEALRRLAG